MHVTKQLTLKHFSTLYKAACPRITVSKVGLTKALGTQIRNLKEVSIKVMSNCLITTYLLSRAANWPIDISQSHGLNVLHWPSEARSAIKTAVDLGEQSVNADVPSVLYFVVN